jgi:hypothetical protein
VCVVCVFKGRLSYGYRAVCVRFPHIFPSYISLIISSPVRTEVNRRCSART